MFFVFSVLPFYTALFSLAAQLVSYKGENKVICIPAVVAVSY